MTWWEYTARLWQHNEAKDQELAQAKGLPTGEVDVDQLQRLMEARRAGNC